MKMKREIKKKIKMENIKTALFCILIMGLVVCCSAFIYIKFVQDSCTVKIYDTYINSSVSLTDLQEKMVLFSSTSVMEMEHSPKNVRDIELNLYESYRDDPLYENNVTGIFRVKNSNDSDPMTFYKHKIKEMYLVVNDYSKDKISINDTLVEDITKEYLLNSENLNPAEVTYSIKKNQTTISKNYSNLYITYFFEGEDIIGIEVIYK